MIAVGEMERLANPIQRVAPIQSLRQLVDLFVIVVLLSLGFLPQKRELLETLQATAFRFGYKNHTIVDGVVTMNPKLPKFLVWDENTVRFVEDAIVVTGPMPATSAQKGIAAVQFRMSERRLHTWRQGRVVACGQSLWCGFGMGC